MVALYCLDGRSFALQHSACVAISKIDKSEKFDRFCLWTCHMRQKIVCGGGPSRTHGKLGLSALGEVWQPWHRKLLAEAADGECLSSGCLLQSARCCIICASSPVSIACRADLSRPSRCLLSRVTARALPSHGSSALCFSSMGLRHHACRARRATPAPEVGRGRFCNQLRTLRADASPASNCHSAAKIQD